MSDKSSISLSFVRELINQQREDFATLLNSMMKSFNERHDNLLTMVCDLKHSLEFSQKELQDVIEKCNTNQDLSSKSTQDLQTQQDSLEKLEDKIDYIENQSRRNNVHFSGIPEDPKETWNQTENKVNAILEKQMGIASSFAIERAHRVGPLKPSAQKPRGVVVKFASYKGREQVLRNGRKLKGSNIYVRDDVSERVIARRNMQMKEYNEAKQQGKIAYFTLDRLIVKNRPNFQPTAYSEAVYSEASVSQLEPEVSSVPERPVTRSISNLANESG